MNLRKQIGLAAILVILLLSIDSPVISPAEVRARTLAITLEEDLACLSKALPKDAVALFFTDVDGTLDFQKGNDLHQYYRAQYQLAPRLIAAFPRASRVQIAEYDWLIGYSLTEDELAEVLAWKSVSMVRKCKRETVLRRLQ